MSDMLQLVVSMVKRASAFKRALIAAPDKLKHIGHLKVPVGRAYPCLVRG